VSSSRAGQRNHVEWLLNWLNSPIPGRVVSVFRQAGETRRERLVGRIASRASEIHWLRVHKLQARDKKPTVLAIPAP